MKSIISLTAIGLAAFAVANSAGAYSLSPANGNFTGKGPTTATVGGVTVGGCTTTLQATNTNGVGSITGGTVTGPGFCSLVTFSNLPWSVTAKTAGAVTVKGAVFSSPAGACGTPTSTMTVHVSAKGVFTYNAAYGNCTNLKVGFHTTPVVTIVSP